jgi:hypothetical protein
VGRELRAWASVGHGLRSSSLLADSPEWARCRDPSEGITGADPGQVFDTLRDSALSAFLVGQQAARLMRENTLDANGARGTIIHERECSAQRLSGERRPSRWPVKPSLGSRRAWCAN